MILTNDQYIGLSMMEKWYNKYSRQRIEISGSVGTGAYDLTEAFIDLMEIDRREIMYLSYDQKQVLELASKGYHSYYIDSVIYKYIKITDLDTVPVLNPNSKVAVSEWKKEVRKKIDHRYKLMIVFDSTLMSQQTIQDLSSFGLPIILLKDPILLPSSDPYSFLTDPDIELSELNDIYLKSPLVMFARKILNMDRLKYGNYDNVTIVPKRQMNLYNIKASDMVITVSDKLRYDINSLYKDRIMNAKIPINIPNERVMVTETLYDQKLVNVDNKKVKVFLLKGTVGTLTKVNRHAMVTRYVGVDFQPDFYHESFTGLYMDRYQLNNIDGVSYQQIPDDIVKLDYAYALSAALSRTSHWDKVTFVVDENELGNEELQMRLMYTAVTRARKSLNIIL